jgi:predicted TIM-barrel fold metal-dependent hydrolase
VTIDFVDSHHHLTDLSRSYPWLERSGPFPYHGDDTSIRRSYFVDDYLADVGDNRLLGSVHVENGAADSRAETVWIDEVIHARGVPSVQVAKADLLDPEGARELEWLTTIESVRGIRQILNWHDDPRYSHTDRPDIISDPVWLKNFARLAPLGLSFDLQVFPSQLRQAAALAERHPETTIILDHAGMPIGRDAASIAQWHAGMVAVAAQPNVWVKISALGTNDHHWTTETLRPFVLDTLELFGAERCMFGSNFPVDSLYSTLQQLIDAYVEITSDLTTAERESFFVTAATRAYRFAPPTTIDGGSLNKEETS